MGTISSFRMIVIQILRYNDTIALSFFTTSTTISISNIFLQRLSRRDRWIGQRYSLNDPYIQAPREEDSNIDI
jgi:hypothetical protein